MTRLTFEDFPLGRKFELDSFTLERQDMVNFARTYDPQAFHLNDENTDKTYPGRMVASGWFLCSLLVREFAKGFLKDSNMYCGAGMPELFWLEAVLPGDKLRMEAVVIESRVSRLRPEIGIVTLSGGFINQHDVKVVSNQVVIFIGRRGETAHPNLPDRSILEEKTVICGNEKAVKLPFFEEIEFGSQWNIGSHIFTAERIRAYASLYDPQPFHLDEVLARQSFLGGLCAAGVHVALTWWTLGILNHNRAEAEALQQGTLYPRLGLMQGFRDLTWYLPVYADDVLTYSAKILKKHELPDRKGWGVLDVQASACNQYGETVINYYPSLVLEMFTNRR